ncbi:MAG: hypothetical protein V4546_12425 [Bacteroidota bacterium]
MANIQIPFLLRFSLNIVDECDPFRDRDSVSELILKIDWKNKILFDRHSRENGNRNAIGG